MPDPILLSCYVRYIRAPVLAVTHHAIVRPATAAHRTYQATGKVVRHWLRHGPLHLTHAGAHVTWATIAVLVCGVAAGGGAVALRGWPPVAARLPSWSGVWTAGGGLSGPGSGQALVFRGRAISVPEPSSIALLAVAAAAMAWRSGRWK